MLLFISIVICLQMYIFCLFVCLFLLNVKKKKNKQTICTQSNYKNTVLFFVFISVLKYNSKDGLSNYHNLKVFVVKFIL